MYKQSVSILATVMKLICWAVVKMKTNSYSAKSRLLHKFQLELNLLHQKRNHKEEKKKEKRKKEGSEKAYIENKHEHCFT